MKDGTAILLMKDEKEFHSMDEKAIHLMKSESSLFDEG